MTRKENLLVEIYNLRNQISEIKGNKIVNIEELSQTRKFREESSEFTLETIEPTEVLFFCKDDIMEYFNSNPEFKEMVMKYIVEKMVDYVHLFLSMQIHTPEQRYAELVKNRPEIIQRSPQHYIASFLGITPVSLSRIRSRK